MSNKRLNAVITIGGTVTGSLKSALGSTKKQLTDISSTIRDLKKRHVDLEGAISKPGSTGRQLRAMRSEYHGIADQIERAKRAQDRLFIAQARSHKLNAIASKTTAVGTGMTVAGVGITAAFMPSLREAKHYQTEQARIAALGMGARTNREATQFAKALKTYGTSNTENLTLVRDAMSVFGDLHHAQMVVPTLAKMKFGNAAFYGAEKGGDNEAKFMDMLKVIELRGGTKSKAAFESQANMVQRVVSATGGRVGPEEWRHLIATGGLAAKSMRDDAFYYQLEPLVQEMGGDRVGTGLMSGYSALYQGRTTKRAVANLEKLGLIGDRSKIEQDKAGQIAHLNVGAIKGAKLFRESQYEWMKKVLIPTLAEKGLTSKDQVLDAIGSIFSSRKGADIMAAMYLQQQQIDKNEKVNRGAADINTIDKAGRKTAAGKEIQAEKKLEDAKLRLGTAVLPVYTSALESAADMLARLNGFTDRHPKLAAAMAKGVAGVGIALVALGPLVTASGALLTGYAALQLRVAIRSAAAATAINAETTAMEAQNVAGGKLLKMRGQLGGALGLGIFGATVYATSELVKAPDNTDATRQSGYKALQAGRYGKAANSLGIGGFYGGLMGLTVTQKKPTALPTPEPARKLPAPASWPRGGTTIHDNSQTTIHIVQQPGQSAKSLADEIESRRKAGRPGSLLYDKPKGY